MVHTLQNLMPGNFSQMRKNDLRHCYNVATAPLGTLKAYIVEHHQAVDPATAAMCQYCGLSYDASDFDHYLPKELFAEFSTLTLNMVPCCGTCNRLKGKVWRDGIGQRQIVSFYFDTVPRRQFLFADIEVTTKLSSRFRLSGNAIHYEGLEATIRGHFEHLDLLERFRKAAPAEFSECSTELKPVIDAKGTESAAELLRRKADQAAQSYSPNYWKVALYQAMARSADFLRFIQNQANNAAR